jgi:ribose/xylose/arabinose/galactoside ABC-type transport system permease subunit
MNNLSLLANRDKITIRSLWQRIKAPMPVFWKKMLAILLTIGGASGSVLVMTGLPHFVYTLATHGVAIGGIGSILSMLSVDWEKMQSNADAAATAPPATTTVTP